MKKISISEVASTAGVSTTTVSRVINAVPTVSEENRQRVLSAIKKLKYHPNPSAQHLAAGKTNTIGVIIPRFEGIFQSYYALEVLKGVGMAAEQIRCDLLLHITDGRSFVNPSAVDGVLFIDVDGEEELIDRVLEDGLSVVVLNHYLEDLPVSCVAVDNKTAAEMVVEYLVRLGHREIATITGDLRTQAGLNRLDGFVKAMRARDLPLQDAYIQHGDFRLPGARAAAERLFALKNRPTAVFAASDDMAVEVVNVALAKGLRVPEELSVVGFDDNPIAAHGRIPLTTVHQPLSEMGRIGLELLRQHVQGKKQSPNKLLLPTKLVERQSCRQTWLER